MIKRYGDFRLYDYIPYLIGITVMLVLAIAGFILFDTSMLSGIPLAYAIIMVFFISRPYNEVFCFEENSITILKGSVVQRRIEIPSQIALIITYTSIDSALSGRSYIIRSKYSITLIHSICQDEALELLHKDIRLRYTNTDIERSFQQNYIYDFVGSVDLLNLMLQCNLEYIIIPRSLYQKNVLPNIAGKVYIDEMY